MGTSNTEKTVRVGCALFCHNGTGKYLINKRSANCRDEHNTWDPGGGGVDFGERVEDTVRREVREEYCTEPLKVELLGFRDVFREQNGEPTHWVMFDFKVRVNPEEVAIGEPHKCDGLRWITIEELASFTEPLHSKFPFFLKKYAEKLK